MLNEILLIVKYFIPKCQIFGAKQNLKLKNGRQPEKPKTQAKIHAPSFSIAIFHLHISPWPFRPNPNNPNSLPQMKLSLNLSLYLFLSPNSDPTPKTLIPTLTLCLSILLLHLSLFLASNLEMEMKELRWAMDGSFWDLDMSTLTLFFLWLWMLAKLVCLVAEFGWNAWNLVVDSMDAPLDSCGAIPCVHTRCSMKVPACLWVCDGSVPWSRDRTHQSLVRSRGGEVMKAELGNVVR